MVKSRSNFFASASLFPTTISGLQQWPYSMVWAGTREAHFAELPNLTVLTRRRQTSKFGPELAIGRGIADPKAAVDFVKNALPGR